MFLLSMHVDIFFVLFQEQLLRLLLDHDPAKRPTSKELLQSEFIPPPQMEVAELNEILRSTISDPQSKSYRRLMDSLFAQSVRPDYDLLYETDLHKVIFLGIYIVYIRLCKNRPLKIPALCDTAMCLQPRACRSNLVL